MVKLIISHNLFRDQVGINPGLFAAFKGHHYAGPGNHFWKCLYLSGLTPEQMAAEDDYKLLKVGIGFTNMVERTTKGSADLTRKEIKDGSKVLLEKLKKFQPKIAVFNGKLIYEVFSGKKEFHFGKQQDLVEGTNTVSRRSSQYTYSDWSCLLSCLKGRNSNIICVLSQPFICSICG